MQYMKRAMLVTLLAMLLSAFWPGAVAVAQCEGNCENPSQISSRIVRAGCLSCFTWQTGWS